MPDSTQWEWSRPVPEVTAGRKVKGTETCGHAVMELGTSLMTGSKNNLKLPSAMVYVWVRWWCGCWWTSRPSICRHLAATQVKWTKALPPLLSPPSFIYLFLPPQPTHTCSRVRDQPHGCSGWPPPTVNPAAVAPRGVGLLNLRVTSTCLL